MAAEEEPDALKIYWEHFFKSETGTYEKSTWLDLFLAEFLLRVNDGANPKELIKFCPVSGVVTLVGCELLCGLHRVTSSITAHFPAPLPPPPPPPPPPPGAEAGGLLDSTESESPPEARPGSLFSRTNAQPAAETLRRYLLGGVAWRCLALLRALGVEGLSCCRQLSSVLVWVFGELTAPAALPAGPAPTPLRGTPAHCSPAGPRVPIHQLFSNKIWSKQKPSGNTAPKINTTNISEKGSTTGRSRHKSETSERSKRKSIKESEPSSESGDTNDELQVLNRSLTIKVCSPADDFDYFTSPLRSPAPPDRCEPYHSPRRARPKADDFMTDRHRELLNADVSAFEFILMITDLLQELSRAESSLSGSEGSQISVQCINFSLRNLCSLQFTSGSGAAAGQNEEQVSRIKVALTELLMVALDEVLIHSDLCAKLINNGILPMLLRLLEDVICKCSTKYQTKTDTPNRAKIETPSQAEANDLLKFVFGIAYSILAFFHCLLMQCRTVDKLREFTDQFKLYSECLKGGLLKDCIELMIRIPGVDEDEAVALIRRLVEAAARLVAAMKRVRSRVLHAAACARARHRACAARVRAGAHHHHDALGPARAGPPAACCVAVLYAALAALAADPALAARAPLRRQLLRALLRCGACCCFPPAALMQSVVRLALTHPAAAAPALRLLERAAYGPREPPGRLPCAVCEPPARARAPCPHGPERDGAWSFLIHYNSLLQLDNHPSVLHATVGHLLRVTPRCRTEMKRELLFGVIYPTFIVAKHRYAIRLEESAYFLTASCLNIFASLLNAVPFAEQFIQKGGLSYVLELVSTPEFSNQCCAILEIAIVVEISKLTRDDPDASPRRDVGQLASVRMLFRSLAEMNDKFYRIYRLRLPEEEFARACAASEEMAALGLAGPARAPEARGAEGAESVESVEDHVEVLKTVGTFWRTCATLCVCSPWFRAAAAGGGAALRASWALLRLALLGLRGGAGAGRRALVRLLEALLTVHFALADVTGGRSARLSCELVRAALAAPGALGDEGAGAGLRALCEALLRVAAARASPRHCMPRHHLAKVPPLLCASGSSSADGSSSDASAGAVRASDLSDGARPDEGYEADVEIGNLDIVAEKARRLSSSLPLSDSSFVSGTAGEASGVGGDAKGAACGAYAAGAELAHPELCVVVVDILTQIVAKVLAGIEDKSMPPEEVSRLAGVGAGVARACGARLAGARAPLLRRVLAPPVAALLTRPHEPPLHELQRSVLELIHVLASSRLEAGALAALLGLFLGDAPPLGVLLGALLRLATPRAVTPDALLTFPTVRHQVSEPVAPLTVEMSNMSLGPVSAQSYHAEALAKRLCDAHIAAGIRSAWSCCAARCGVEGAGWAPWAGGFALAAWLRAAPAHAAASLSAREPSNWDDVDEWQEESGSSAPAPETRSSGALAHVVSLGTDSLLFEVWLDVRAGSLVFRLSRPEAAGGAAMAEARLETGARAWAHLALNVHERVHKRRIHVQVTVFINGLELDTITLPLQGILVRKVSPTNLLLGWAPADAGGAEAGAGADAYHLAGVSVYRAPLLSTYTALHLAAHGPDNSCYVLSPTNLLLGWAAADASGAETGAGADAYHLAGVSVYRAPLLSTYTALHLAAHGPDNSCYVRCESPHFASVLTPNILDSNIDWDQVFDLPSNVLRELHDNLLLTFTAHAPAVVNLYHQSTLNVPTVFGSRVSGGGSPGGAGGAPEAVGVAWAGAALPSRHEGLAPALHALGGPEVLLYLYARVVELDGSPTEQAAALRLLLRAAGLDARLHAAALAPPTLDMLLVVLASPKCHVGHHLLRPTAAAGGGLDARLHAAHTRHAARRARQPQVPRGTPPAAGECSLQLQQAAGWTRACTPPTLDMLLVVLASPKCHVGHHLLRVVLEEACSAPVLALGAGGSLTVLRSGAALLEPALFAMLLRAWPQLDSSPEVTWEVEGVGARAQGSAWALLLACGASLLRAQHPLRRFNAHQAARADLLRHLLVACKERFLNSDCPPLSAATSNTLVELVGALLGAPPLLPHVALLADFLLLMHQASDTFVTHSRANFYFLLTPETQEMSDFNTNSLKKKPSRRRRQERASVTSAPAEGVPVDSAPSEGTPTEAGEPRDTGQLTDTDAEKTDPDSSVDSTKKMKGIINSQIKENQKTTDTSSVTETSDPPPAVERARAGARDADLTEYIVVDVDDVSHTTVDLYTGGIYHQRRLRAGAEPGWTACEGLLLLLRDAVAVLPDDQLAQALCGAVSVESLIVLANHRSGSVRAALVRVLAALQRRDPPDLARKLRHQHYLLHLANQISLYEGTWELAEACAALLTKCDVPLEDQLDEDIWVEARDEWTWRAAPLLALLPCCLRCVPLAHNVARLLVRLVHVSSLRALGEVCLAEVVVRAVRGAGALGAREGRSLLQQDLHDLLEAVALKALAAPHGMQTICDIHYQLTFVEQTESDEEVRIACRSAQAALFNAQLAQLEERLADAAPHNKYATYFSTVLSSAMSVGGEARVDRAELAARHVATVTRALAFLQSHSPRDPLPPAHAALYDRLLATLLIAVSGSSSGTRARWWSGGGAEWAALLQEAVWWGGAPGSGARELQPRLLRRLYRASPQALQALTPQEPGASRQLAVYLLLILQNQHLQAEAGTPGVELAITDWARGWAVSTQAALPARLSSDSLAAEGAALLARDLARWAAARARHQPAIARAVFRKQAVCARLAEGAMAVTRAAVEAQNAERKGFMQHLRRRHAARHAAATRWARLVRDYTHDRAVFHEPRSWPASWQLDPTEGPGRVRVRLRRAHLRIHKRFLQPAQQYKPDLAKRPPPLRSVLGRSATERDGLAARLQLNECVACMARVTHVTHDSETCGELLLTDRSIHFVPEESGSDDESWEPWAAGRAQCWSLGSVTAVGTRRWCLQERAVELFLASGHAQLLAFDSEAERANFLKALKNCHLPNKQEEDTLAEAMNQWRNGSITNWEYLMRLNGLAGRSYNDLMQYPVLPFVLADYTSRVLDLTAPETFRDLTKPMAVQRKSREQHYINTYNDLKAARREGCSPVVARQPHHYASLYSNSGGVLHYLVRLPPFTELFLNYQDNNFDMPDRTFHSLATTWRLITNDSPTDVKELIPELFYLPELFHNNEGLELGVRQCGLGVDDVEVPAWAAEARAFVLLHRQALEAPHVTERLPHWLDLVLGYKQTGQAAVDALNVFPACTYYGFDPAALEDEVDRTAAAAMVRTYGQAPRQLLRQPHPHAAHELTRAAPHRQLEAWGGAIGVRWGRYCGSPELPDPVVVARRAGSASVVPLPAPRLAAALPQATALLALPGDASSNSAGGGAWGVVSWGHWDGIVRLRQRRDAPPDLLLQVPPLDQITLMTSSTSASCPVIVGYASGRVEAWRVSVVRGAPPRLRARALLAHRAPLAAAHACPPAATLATADTHGVILLWDLAELTYIRTLPNRDMLPVTHLAISPTLSDVASVHDTARSPDSPDAPDARVQPPGQDGDADSYERDATDKYQSLIRVHTVNGRFVGSVRVTERVTCVCYSAAAEGASVNVVAAGLAGGGAALYSSWDLRPVARLPPALAGPARPTPLCSLAYSSDSMALFGCYADGWAVAWEAGGAGAGRSAHLLPAHALL